MLHSAHPSRRGSAAASSPNIIGGTEFGTYWLRRATAEAMDSSKYRIFAQASTGVLGRVVPFPDETGAAGLRSAVRGCLKRWGPVWW
jgi:hypothetical protein